MDKANAQSIDLERSLDAAVIFPNGNSLEKIPSSSDSSVHYPVTVPSRLAQWNARIERLGGLEVRGIARVPPEERHESSVLGYARMAMLWFSMNVTVLNCAVGLLGPLVLNLGFVDSVMMQMFGSLVGSAVVAYMSIWGAQSGNRTMVCSHSAR